MLIEFVEVTLDEFDAESLAGFSLDYPRPGTITDASAVEVWGWVVGGSSPAIAMEIVSEGRVIRRAPVDGPRPDVAAIYSRHPEAERAGFRLTAATLNVTELQLQVVLKNQRRVPVVRLRAQPRWRDQGNTEAPLVSVVIPCYNQAHYLSEAIESVLAQTYPQVEVVVVDDGSVDNTVAVAARYPGVRCETQKNGGLASARNTGIRLSNGPYLVFLDADDRLLPGALEAGLKCFEAHPDSAFVSGRFRFIAIDGSNIGDDLGFTIESDHYAAMLRRNYIPMHATVMFRRNVFESVIGYDVSLPACEDYDLYLRITRLFPVACHEAVVAEYRRYGSSMSNNSPLMLKTALTVLKSQRRYTRTSKEYRDAYAAGIEFWSNLFGQPLVEQVRRDVRRGDWRTVIRNVVLLVRLYPRGMVTVFKREIERT